VIGNINASSESAERKGLDNDSEALYVTDHTVH
jgi:hypothetical protein